jgi:hypothetical protein
VQDRNDDRSQDCENSKGDDRHDSSPLVPGMGGR